VEFVVKAAGQWQRQRQGQQIVALTLMVLDGVTETKFTDVITEQ